MNNLACAAKQQSVLENELDQLMSVVSKVNSLSESILYMVKAPTPCCEKCSPKDEVRTIAGSLVDIRYIAQEAGNRLDDVARCLEEQLGSLKLEY